MEKEILAAIAAVTSDVENTTNDRLEALTKGHGILNLAVLCAANAMTDEILLGRDIQLTRSNLDTIVLEQIIDLGVKAAMGAGAAPPNAALIVATLLNLAGTASRVAVASANRKLGAMARMRAGADRGGVVAIPTAKANNKVSGFAAVQALYNAMDKGELVRIDGADVPAFVAGGPIYGHNALGEDIVYPDITLRGGRIAVEAMMRAYRGVGMRPNPLQCAVISAAAVLELVNPDGMIGEEYGQYQLQSVSTLAGRGAREAAGLPRTLHMRGTGREYNTDQLIGDMGMILKDIGTPSVIGMITFNDIFGAFAESSLIGVGWGCSNGPPVNPPLGRLAADAVIVMHSLIANKGDMELTADLLKGVKESQWFDPEIACISSNTVARKAEQIRRGPVTRTIIKATDGVRARAYYRWAKFAYDGLNKGRRLEEICSDLDKEKQMKVEERAGKILSSTYGKDVRIKFTKLAGGARRDNPTVKKYWSLDMDIDIEVTIDGEKTVMNGLAHKVVPDAVLNKRANLLLPLSIAAQVSNELVFMSCCCAHVVIPASIAAAMGKMGFEEAAEHADKGARLSSAIVGSREKASDVAKLAVRIMKDL